MKIIEDTFEVFFFEYLSWFSTLLKLIFFKFPLYKRTWLSVSFLPSEMN